MINKKGVFAHLVFKHLSRKQICHTLRQFPAEQAAQKNINPSQPISASFPAEQAAQKTVNSVAVAVCAFPAEQAAQK